MGIVQTDEEQSCIQDGRRGSEGRGQSNFELSINSDYVHEGRLPLAKVCVNAGSQSLL